VGKAAAGARGGGQRLAGRAVPESEQRSPGRRPWVLFSCLQLHVSVSCACQNDRAPADRSLADAMPHRGKRQPAEHQWTPATHVPGWGPSSHPSHPSHRRHRSAPSWRGAHKSWTRRAVCIPMHERHRHPAIAIAARLSSQRSAAQLSGRDSGSNRPLAPPFI
jgi:hypothetical protein